MMPPGNAREAGGQDPSQGPSGGQKPPGSAGLATLPTRQIAGQDRARGGGNGQAPVPSRTDGGRSVRAGQDPSGREGQNPPGQGPIKRPVGAAQLSHQAGSGVQVRPAAGGNGSDTRGLPASNAQANQQSGSGVNMKGECCGGGTQRQLPGSVGQPPLSRTGASQGLPGEALTGQPNPAANNAAQALR